MWEAGLEALPVPVESLRLRLRYFRYFSLLDFQQ